MAEYKDMITDELVAARDELVQQREAVRAKLSAISAVIGSREAEESLQKKLASMSPAEVEALKRLTQKVEPKGVDI